MDKATANKWLFERNVSSQVVSGGPGTEGSWVGFNNSPNGYHNWAGSLLIQELVLKITLNNDFLKKNAMYP